MRCTCALSCVLMTYNLSLKSVVLRRARMYLVVGWLAYDSGGFRGN
jgi:hypothetical protein